MNRHSKRPAARPGNREGGNRPPVYDREEFLARTLGDAALVREIEDTFLEDLLVQLRRLDEAVSAGDFAAAEDRAHQIKGAAANLGAEALREEALQLEDAARFGNREEAVRLLPVLKRGFAETVEAIRRERNDE